MNVLVVIEGTYPWYRGGVSEWIYQYLIHLPEYQFTILQIATDTFIHEDPNNALYPIPENVEKFYRIQPPELKSDWKNSFNKWLADSKEITDELLDKHDVIHVTNTGFAGWLGSEIAKVSNKPLILTEHAIYWLEIDVGAVALECGYKIPSGKEEKNNVIKLFKELASIVYERSDKIISVSRHNVKYQQDLGATGVSYIPNGIPENWIKETSEKRNKLTIGWVGRCAEMKNPLQLFDFADIFRNLNIDMSFLMLMSDAGEDNLEKEVRDKIDVYPEVNLIWNENAKNYYEFMDMLLITSHNESQPLVMFEALANNVLPVGRSVGDFTNEFGLAFPKDFSDSQIVSELFNFWNDKDAFTTYLSDRVQKVSDDHTWSVIFSKYKSLFSDLVAEYEVKVS